MDETSAPTSEADINAAKLLELKHLAGNAAQVMMRAAQEIHGHVMAKYATALATGHPLVKANFERDMKVVDGLYTMADRLGTAAQ